jgi:DNA-binding Lrp family transcriptional regulator
MDGEPSGAPRGHGSLDAVDLHLLALLAVDARSSLRSLGAAVGLSGPAVADRIARLTERGVIRGFTVDIDWALLGVPTVAHISLLTDKSSHIETILGELRGIERVEEVSIVTGATDLLVRARVADLTELRQLLVEHIWPIAGVQRVETALAVQTERAPGFVVGMLSRGRATEAARPTTSPVDAVLAEQAAKESRDAPR